MTIVTSLIEKVNSRLNKELLIDSYKKKKKYIKISAFSNIAFLWGLYGMVTADDSVGGFILIYAVFIIIGFFSTIINVENFLDNIKKCKMVINNDIPKLHNEHYRKQLSNDELNELLSLDLPDYAIEQLFKNIEHDWGIKYNDLREIEKLLEKGEEDYTNEKLKDDKHKRMQFKRFISKNKINEHSVATVNRILSLGMKDKQHTKTFNSKKVL